MATPNSLPPEPGPNASIDEIQADIERTRAQLGDTVGALSEKLDVKKHASEKAVELKEKAVPAVPIALGVSVVAIIGLVIWRRRRRR
jgi:hypothetical protein